MIEHQVIETIKTFSPEEVKQFRRYLSSPYFNRSTVLVEIFELLAKFYPDFNSRKLTKEYISEVVFKCEEYKDSTVRNALYELQTLTEEFLTQENFRKSTVLSFDCLLKELREKKLTGVFEKNSSFLDKKYSEIKNVDTDYYLSRYKLELNKFNYSELFNRANEDKDTTNQIERIKYSGIFITVHYIIEIVSIYLTSVNFGLAYNKPQAKEFLSSLIRTLNIKGLEEVFEGCEHYFIVQIYIALLKTFENINDEESYLNYKSLVKANISKLGKDEIWFHYSNFINYCYFMKMDKSKNAKYNDELFDIYEEILKNDYYKNNKIDYLRIELYRNILVLGIQQKRINWVENFIISCSPKLHKSEKDNMMNFAYAYLCYEKGEYLLSWKYFNKIKIDYYIYKYDIKNFALKIYMELGYFEEALTLAENYKKFLQRNKLLSEEEKTAYKNFILYFTKLLLFKVGQLPQKHFSTYRRRLEQSVHTSNRLWLMQKYEEQAAGMKQSRIAKSA